MKTLIAFVFSIGLILTEVVTTQAMPIQRHVLSQEALTTQVGYRCGFGAPLDTHGNCTPVYRGYYQGHRRGYYEGYRRGHYLDYRHAYYDFPYVRLSGRIDPIVVDKGFCGFGSYLSCDFGGCWRFCY